jgi:3-oxoacyl-(acyl-carrier-protein) synthase
MSTGQTVHIIGAEALCAAGATLERCMETMLAGSTHPGPPAQFESQLPHAYPVFGVLDHDLTQNDPALTRTANLALTAMDNALRGAGLRDSALAGHRVGVCIGTSVGASLNFLDFYRAWRHGDEPDMAPIRRYLRSNPAEVLAGRGNCSGPCQTVVNACTSGTDAIGIGAAWIRHGLCDVVIAGGADELSEISYTGFASLMITSPEPCRPFDKDRNGLNLGEGAGILVLASEPAREALSLLSRGIVAGYGTYGDAYHLTAPHPEARGLRRALDQALAQAGTRERDIDFINVHGTGTSTNDLVEAGALRDRFPGIQFSATKGFTGHTLGAAGAIEAAFTLACLERGEIPPSQGFVTVDPEIGLAPVARRTPLAGQYGLSQSLAFGGNNSVLIIRRGGACD